MASQPEPAEWVCGARRLDWRSRPLVMGILNVTPDSFSDGGRFPDAPAAAAAALALAAAGADIVDIGGESTRPGAEPVDAATETGRVLPVIEALHGQCPAAISVDTTKAVVARAALAAGAHIINDVSACTADPAMVEVLRDSGAGVVLMHRQGTPATMQANPQYADVVGEVCDYLAARARALQAAGVAAARIVLDPGIGFGKTLAHNTRLLGRLDALVGLGYPVAVGLSRKRMLGELTGRPLAERFAGTVAGVAWAVAQGAAVLRVHDVAAARDAVLVTQALRDAGREG